jgi:hypothetical protein
MLTEFYLTLRLRLNPALWSKDEGFLRVNPEQSPEVTLESPRVNLSLLRRIKSRFLIVPEFPDERAKSIFQTLSIRRKNE